MQEFELSFQGHLKLLERDNVPLKLDQTLGNLQMVTVYFVHSNKKFDEDRTSQLVKCREMSLSCNLGCLRVSFLVFKAPKMFALVLQ